MAGSGVKNKGGLTVRLERGESFFIGDDIEIILQRNNSPGSKETSIRVIAPKHLKISRDRFDSGHMIKKFNNLNSETNNEVTNE